jgi:uncharacterized peroxidase-related enzyme
MTQPAHITALDLPLPDPDQLDDDLREYFAKCDHKLGFVPNVLKAYSFDQAKLRAFNNFYDDLMLGDSALSKLEREMIAVVVSAANRCYYCLTAHGAAVRKLSGDPVLGELLVMNYRAADLPARQRSMLDFAHKVAVESSQICEADRDKLRAQGFADRDIWDIAAVAAFFSMTNRLASAVDMMPNAEYAGLARETR